MVNQYESGPGNGYEKQERNHEGTMATKKYTIGQGMKAIKLTKTSEAPDRVWSLLGMMESDGNDHLLDVESEELARIMMGWHPSHSNGLLAEFRHFSGLEKRANKWIAANMATTFRLRETHVEGNGISTYSIA